MHEFEPLVGAWLGTGEIPLEPPMSLAIDATVERLGQFVLLRSTTAEGAVPDSISIIGGAPEDEPQPMHYFDARGVQRHYLTAIDGSSWQIWLAPGEDWNGPDGPGFNQRFIGKISVNGRIIEGRWERGLGPAGDQWELDFPLTYTRR
jgi:hypothetical protein